MLSELRIYETMSGKLPALNDRFANHTAGFFRKHGIGMLGYDGLGERERSWKAFQDDAEWQKARAESERDGPLVKRSHSRILRPTAYSPR